MFIVSLNVLNNDIWNINNISYKLGKLAQITYNSVYGKQS